jgi:hypothetical protein
MARYAIWDRQTPIITHTGKIYTAAEWVQRHPVLGLSSVVPVCGGGEINGAYMGTLGAMVERAEREGCDFSDCVTNEEKLARVEEHEKRAGERTAASAEERIAAALEYQNLMAD